MKKIIKLIKRDTGKRTYIPILDGIRFLAILLVVLQHLNERLWKYNPSLEIVNDLENQLTFYISRGSIGVLIFFTLSGMIISLPFAKQVHNKEPFSYKNYLLRRLTRLEPPYIIWMTLFGIVLLIQSNLPFIEVFKHYLASITYMHGIVYQSFSIINPVAWSLEVEIQFYLIAPFICHAYFKYNAITYRMLSLLVLIIAVISLQHYFALHLLPWRASILGQFHLFLIGLFLADLYCCTKVLKAGESILWDVMVCLSLYVMAITWTEEYFKTLVFSLAILILFVGILKTRWLKKLLCIPLITGIGGMCYTIYLIHLPLVEGISLLIPKLFVPANFTIGILLYTAIIIPLVFIFSVLGYLLIEKPFMVIRSFNISYLLKYFKNSVVFIQFKIPYKNIGLVLLITLGVISVKPVMAQTNNDLKELHIDRILPLEEIIALSDLNAMHVQALNQNQKQIEQELTIVKKNWTEHIFLTASANRGSGAIADQLITINTSGDTYLTRQNSGYNVGINIYLPVSKVSSRRNEIETYKYRLEAIEYEKKHQLALLHKEVIKNYKEFRYHLKSISLYSEKVALNASAMILAEEYFKNGRIEMKEYTGTVDVYYNSEIQLEKAKNESYYCLQMLEELAGSSIIKK